jgi:carbon-monoxide dehydrogenase medium subunit
MIPKKFDYYSPASLQEAVQLLHENEGAKILAGGQSLLPLMKLRLAAPTALIDISKLSDLSYVRDEGDYLAIGALTTYDEIERNPTIREEFALVNDAIVRIGDQQVRNLGTIGGSACHADPAGDLPTVLLVADAQFVIEGRNGKRVVPASGFFVDLFATAVGDDEVLTEVRLPYLPPKSASAYVKHSLREADFGLAMVGVVISLENGNVCKDVRIGIGAAGPTPMRSTPAERYLRGRIPDEKTVGEAAERAVEGASPASDVHGNKWYRLEMIKVLTRRSLELALYRAGSESVMQEQWP